MKNLLKQCWLKPVTDITCVVEITKQAATVHTHHNNTQLSHNSYVHSRGQQQTVKL